MQAEGVDKSQIKEFHEIEFNGLKKLN